MSSKALILASAVMATVVHLANASPLTTGASSDPCAVIAGQLPFVPVADALACQKSFLFNETLRQNVLSVVSGVFDFYTFENFYLDSPPPFQDSTTNIRNDLARINSTVYETDYDFNQDLFNFTNQLNDGHTLWESNCYWNAWESILPAPIIALADDPTQSEKPSIFIAPDTVDFINLIGDEFTSFFTSMDVDWQSLAGAQVTAIEGMDPWDHVEMLADTVTGTFLDHNVRINSVFTSYRLSGDSFSQRFGDFSGRLFSDLEGVTMSVIPVNATEEETVFIPFLAVFMGNEFTDSESYWANNCAANSETNGVDLLLTPAIVGIPSQPRRPKGLIHSGPEGIGLPNRFQPTLPQVGSSNGAIKSYVLDNQTGVMFVGSFPLDDEGEFESDTLAAMTALQEAGVTRVLIDLTNNPGGDVCLGIFLHSMFAGSNFGYAGYESTIRGNELAQKIVAANSQLRIAPGVNSYAPSNYDFLNGTALPSSFNYESPLLPMTVNGQSDPTSQRLHDGAICGTASVPIPENPPFDFSNVAIVSNGNCASTCAQFSTIMTERHNVTQIVFGGNPTESIEFKGTAGEQVLEWFDLDSEIKTAGLKDDPLAPPDLLVSADMRHNWRTCYSFLDEDTPIAYLSEQPTLRFLYTADTYNNPQNVWTFAASQVFN